MARYMTRKERERRAQNLCIDCGVPLETQKRKFVKCPECRAKQTEASRPYRNLHKSKLLEGIGPEPTPNELWAREKMRREAEQEAKKHRFERQKQKCLCCEWVKIEGNILFCPFPKGTCEKGDYNLGKNHPDQGQRGENPI